MPTLAGALTEKLLTGDAETLRIVALASKVAASDCSVLILGEPGTGKTLLARLIHAGGAADGSRHGPERPFVELACANLPPDLVESELFGHERGAFTGAVEQRIGRFERADGGSLFLDGITDLPPALQAKLLRVLEERSFERLGGGGTIRVSVRILCSARPCIEGMVERGEFREDLYYRINVVTLRLPPLRKRRGDVALLAGRFLEESARSSGSPVRRFTTEAAEFLDRYEWPGNVRELRNACEFAALRAAGAEATLADLPLEAMRAGSGLVAHAGAREMTLEQLEAAYIREVLRRTGGNRTAAARILGINRKTLLEKRRRYGLD